MFSEVAEIARLAQIYLLIGTEIDFKRGDSYREKVLQFFSQRKLGKIRVPLTRSRVYELPIPSSYGPPSQKPKNYISSYHLFRNCKSLAPRDNRRSR